MYVNKCNIEFNEINIKNNTIGSFIFLQSVENLEMSRLKNKTINKFSPNLGWVLKNDGLGRYRGLKKTNKCIQTGNVQLKIHLLGK